MLQDRTLTVNVGILAWHPMCAPRPCLNISFASHLYRLQRLALVENEGFHKSLLEAAISETSSDHLRHRALDLLLWLTSIHTAAGEEAVLCAVAPL